MATENIVRCDIHGETAPAGDNEFNRVSVVLDDGERVASIVAVDYCGETDRHELIRHITTEMHRQGDELTGVESQEPNGDGPHTTLGDVVTVEFGEAQTKEIDPITRLLKRP